MPYYLERKFITAPSIDGEVGSFSLVTPVSFEHCREKFAVNFTQFTTEFYFMHREGRGEHIAAFLEKLETVLELEEKSNFSLTNRSHIICVRASSFWLKCSMRRSLLTCLLRSGMVYDSRRNNFQEALFSHEYLKRTRKALMRFLFGFTEYKASQDSLYSTANITIKGWLSVFEFKDEEFIRRTLVSPSMTDTMSSIDLGEPLWL